MIEEVIKKKKPPSNNYFTQETEDAIVAYNRATSTDEKAKIYHRYIHYAFFKLTENIIHTFKFYYTEVDNIEDLQHEIITFLLQKIHLFDPSKGAKAYSYFGTIVKRYLIIQNTKNYKKRVDKAPVEELYKDLNHSYELDTPLNQADYISDFIDQYVEYCSENIYELFPKDKDAQVADAILEVFRKRENIDIFNKKALYIYIREITGIETPVITKVVKIMREYFNKYYSDFLERGHIYNYE